MTVSSYGDHLLITGATGWLGQSLVARLMQPGLATIDRLTLLSSRAGRRRIAGQYMSTRSLAHCATEDTGATILVHCAFATREYLDRWGESRYAEVNSAITANALELARRPSIRAVVHTSSGAAVDGSLDAYASQKAEEEQLFHDVGASRGIPVLTARVWSVSGPFCTKPEGFAFSTFIQQATQDGIVQVKAQQPVWRRYIDAGEFMELSLRAVLAGESGVVDSTGSLVEIHDLARLVGRLLNARVEAPPLDPALGPSSYYSDSPRMEELATSLGVGVSSLQEQIANTAAGLTSGRRPGSERDRL